MANSSIKQLIFIVESDIDYGYIRNTIMGFYDVSNIRLDKIIANGKNKLLEDSILEKINKKMEGFDEDTGISIVIYCYDTDDLSLKKEHIDFEIKLQNYCKLNGYDFIWFNRTIEEVFLGHIISENKRKDMIRYISRNDKDFNIISKNGAKAKKNSNIILVLDKYLKRK